MAMFLLALLQLASGAGHVVTLDWAKCCDCEADENAEGDNKGLLKAPGDACTIDIKRDQSLKLKYDGSMWGHNLFKVASQADLDSCTMGEAVVDGVGVKSMDTLLEFEGPGTYFYACSVMCTAETAAGGEAMAEYCHCSAFNHKLIVTVLDEDHASGDHDHDHDDDDKESVAWGMVPISVLLALQ
jgi:hypothetical protein